MDFKIPLQYKFRKPKSEGSNPLLFVLIHGYGADEEDLFGFERDLPSEAFVVSLRAPNSLPFGGFYWYQINMQAGAKLYDSQEAENSMLLIKESLEIIKKSLQIPAKNIFLIGFSQGSILSYALSIRYPEKAKHIVAISGYWDDKIVGEADKEKDFSNLDFFISHGKSDPVIPVSLSEIAPNRLQELGVSHQYKVYNSGHNINRDNYEDMLLWVKNRI